MQKESESIPGRKANILSSKQRKNINMKYDQKVLQPPIRISCRTWTQYRAKCNQFENIKREVVSINQEKENQDKMKAEYVNHGPSKGIEECLFHHEAH